MTAGDDVRVRFAPSPTGFLHVGGARTALFNWLYARHTGGTFVLRIEDTDVERSRQDWTEGIQTTLRWLGLDWDEGPYFQSARFDRHLGVAHQLLASGAAYECFCTEEEITARYEARKARGPADPGYDGHCRSLTAAERARLAGGGRPRSIRFRTPDEGVSSFTDVIRGEVTVPWSTIPDFVIVRTSGAPVFYLANAVDDADTGITHVIRGEDLTDTTHRMLAVRAALGIPGRPVFAHLPLLVGADRAKLSKRHGAVSLEDFRDRGYLPEAMVNYVALLGWAPGGDREFLTLDEMITDFRLEDVVASPAFFDMKKLDHFNGEYIRALPLDEFVQRCDAWLPPEWDRDRFRRIAHEVQTRVTVLSDAPGMVDFLFFDEPEIDDKSWDKGVVRARSAAEILDGALAVYATCDWTADDIARVTAEVGDAAGVPQVGKAQAPIRVAITGRTVGPPLWQSMEILGREATLARLTSARQRLARG